MQPKNKDFKQLQGNLIFLFKQLERLNCDPNLRAECVIRVSYSRVKFAMEPVKEVCLTILNINHNNNEYFGDAQYKLYFMKNTQVK